MGDLGDGGGILLDAIAIADVGERNHGRAFVDQVRIAAERDAVARGGDVDDLRAAGFLRVPDLGYGRKGKVVYHDLVARAGEVRWRWPGC